MKDKTEAFLISLFMVGAHAFGFYTFEESIILLLALVYMSIGSIMTEVNNDE